VQSIILKLALASALVASVLYIHYRGRVRARWSRQLLDHSSFMAPINVLMYLCSKVPTTPFIDPSRSFPQLEVLRQNWQMIRDEALALREANNIAAASSYNDVGFNSFFRRGWKRFYLKWYGPAHPSAQQLCPKTVALLETLPDVRAAMFAQLPPGSELRPHRDPYAGSLRLHLGLVTPNDDGCFIEVDGQRHSWRDGQWTMFDETYIHHARNDTDHDRVILFCDIARPLRFGWANALNGFVSHTLLAGGASPNLPGDPTGGVNRSFKYVYALRLKAKALRARSAPAYHAIKWGLVAAAVVLVIKL
jgi:beta-hydroxylase